MEVDRRERELVLLKREYEMLQNNLLGFSNKFEYDFNNESKNDGGTKRGNKTPNLRIWSEKSGFGSLDQNLYSQLG